MTIPKTRIIAEIGVNHNGSPALARRLIDAAAEAGADAAKFQSFVSGSIVSAFAEKAAYQKRTTAAEESQLDMLKRLQLSAEVTRELQEYCLSKNISFMSTPFDEESLNLLHGIDVPVIKIASGEATNLPLLAAVGRTKRNILLSTGMCTLGEIEQALAALSYGLTADADDPPSLRKLRQSYVSEAGQEALRAKVTLLHAVTEYPAPFPGVNLRAMRTLETAFGLPVGLSDHSPGFAVPIAAVALGACVIEKHLTLDNGLPGPDHRASLEPEPFRRMVEGIRQIEQALGSPRKLPTPEERGNTPVVRRSLVADRPIEAGETFSPANVTAKRPETGMTPDRYWELLGTKALRSYGKDEPIR